MEKRWWVNTKKRLGFPDIILKRKIGGKSRYRKLVFRWYYWLVIAPFLGTTALGALCLALFFATRYGWTNAGSGIDTLSDSYQALALELQQQPQVLGDSTTSATELTSPTKRLSDIQTTITGLEDNLSLNQQNICELAALTPLAPYESYKIQQAWAHYSPRVISRMIFAAAEAAQVDLKAPAAACLNSLTADQNYADQVWQTITTTVNQDELASVYDWLEPQYWQVAKQALAKDKLAIIKAGRDVGLNPRLIVSNLVVEQLRLYFSQRELFQQFFQPLKILSNSTNISLGVMAIKPETARQIEQHLKDPTSPYYLGSAYEHLLDYPAGTNPDAARSTRLASEENQHYWSYLYGALYIKEIMTQWERAGYSINERPEIICTLYNVGFPQSSPKSNPRVGGSTVVINGHSYSFGHLANEFYFSGELLLDYPDLESGWQT
jgi:hypothetical protein